MIVKISRHVFGSDRGYRTLAASPDLTAQEVTELEFFAFGQTDNPEYLASLELSPAYWSRALESGRRAITRVLRGPVDEHGRQALRFVTAVIFAEDWLQALYGEDVSLVRAAQIWQWNGQPNLPRADVAIAKPPRVRPTRDQRARILTLLDLIETTCDSSTASIVLDPQDANADDVAMTLALLPVWYRPQFSYAVRSLSEALPVQLNLLTAGASRGKSRRKIIRWSQGRAQPAGKYSAALAHFWSPGDSPPWEFVNNCKAFGALLPTTHSQGVGTASAEPSVVTPGRSRHPRRPLHIPMYFYWILAVVAVIASTGLIMARTLQVRHEARTVLAEAESFLAEHADAAQLPASEDGRRALLHQAKSHSDRVDALHDASQKEHQAEVSNKLERWIDNAGEHSTEYKDLDDFLASFDGFMTPLGVDELKELRRIPDADTRSKVRSWKTKLQEREIQSNGLPPVYAEHIKRRLGTIIHWETSVRNAIDNSRKSLKALEEFFSAPLPKELNEEIVARWEHDQENLKGIGELLGPPENKPNEVATADSVDQEVSELRDTLARIKRRAEEWRARITDLRDEFDKSLNQAREFIAEQKLEFDPVRADDLEKPWGAAANAGSALEQALVIWPDAQDALKLSQTVQDWVKKASTLARDYFEREVSRASQIWTAERTRVANITTNGTEHGVPNPYPAGDVLDNALDYWKRNEVLIRKLDKNGADALNLKAEALKGELIAAKDRYNAKMRTPTPQPTASP